MSGNGKIDRETINQDGKRIVRCPVLLDTRYPNEKALLDILAAVPNRGKASFLRELILRGFEATLGQK